MAGRAARREHRQEAFHGAWVSRSAQRPARRLLPFTREPGECTGITSGAGALLTPRATRAQRILKLIFSATGAARSGPNGQEQGHSGKQRETARNAWKQRVTAVRQRMTKDAISATAKDDLACNTTQHTRRGEMRLALVEFAHGVFDVLAQQAPLVGRHVAVAAALVEIGRNGVALIDVRSGTRRHVVAHPTNGRPAAVAGRTGPVTEGLGVCRRRIQCSHDAAGQRQSNHGVAHCRPDPSHRFVPFLTRQTATSIALFGPSSTRALVQNRMKYLPNGRST
ncbi:hypothetical protein PT2222_310078 [Paraburkholderia tropica]